MLFFTKKEDKARGIEKMVWNITLPFKKCWNDSKFRMDVYVKNFEKHAFDPLLSNKKTDYYHEIFYLKKYKAKGEVLHKLISIFYNV